MINWGRPGWKFLHAITFAYPSNPSPKTKQRYLAFFKSIRHVLPCAACRKGYSVHVKNLSLRPFKNRDTLSHWLVGVHNKVNFKLGKQLYGYNQVKKMYT